MHALDAAGGNSKEGRQGFPGYIEGEAVHGDPLFHPDADGGYFTVFYPDPYQPFPDAGLHAEPGTGFNQGVFQGGDVTVQIPAAAVQVRNGVSDQLAGAVVGGLAAAVDFMNGKGKHGTGVQAGVVPCTPDGINPGMFQQQQFVFPVRVFLMGPDQLFLEPQGFLIICQAGNADDVHAAEGRPRDS